MIIQTLFKLLKVFFKGTSCVLLTIGTRHKNVKLFEIFSFLAEISRQLIESSAKLIITLTDLWPLVSAAKQVMKKDIPIMTINSQVKNKIF